MNQIQIFDCPELDGVYTQDFIDNFNRLAMACRNPLSFKRLSTKKVICNGDFLKLPLEIKDMIYAYVVDWNGIINTIKMVAFRPQVMLDQTHNSAPNLLICGNKQISIEAIEAYRRTPLVLDDTELGDLLVGRFDRLVSISTMRHIQHVKFVFDYEARSDRLNPYKELVRAIANDNSELLTLTFVFMDDESKAKTWKFDMEGILAKRTMREIMDPTTNFLIPGWTDWDGWDVLTMLEDIWTWFIGPQLEAMCAECKKGYKRKEDGSLVYGCRGAGLESSDYEGRTPM